MTYRADGEIAKLRAEHDPLNLFRHRVIGSALLQAAELDAIDAEVKARIAKSVATAKAAPMPTEADLLTDVYNKY